MLCRGGRISWQADSLSLVGERDGGEGPDRSSDPHLFFDNRERLREPVWSVRSRAVPPQYRGQGASAPWSDLAAMGHSGTCPSWPRHHRTSDIPARFCPHADSTIGRILSSQVAAGDSPHRSTCLR